MKILHLTLKKKWFDAVASGQKKEEYREDKLYWRKRLSYKYPGLEYAAYKKFDRVLFTNGYGKNRPSVLIDCLDISRSHLIVEGLSGGKARNYFVIRLGNIREYSSQEFTCLPPWRHNDHTITES